MSILGSRKLRRALRSSRRTNLTRRPQNRANLLHQCGIYLTLAGSLILIGEGECLLRFADLGEVLRG
jgi:hypothetical protein